MSYQPQDHAEARLRKQTAILRVCNLPYLAEYVWGYIGALEEGDGVLSCDHSQLVLVGLLEEVGECALLVGAEIKNGVFWTRY